MPRSTRFLLVGLAVAVAGAVLCTTSFIAGLAMPWLVSLAEGEQTTFRVTTILTAVIALAVTAIVRSRRSDGADQP